MSFTSDICHLQNIGAQHNPHTFWRDRTAVTLRYIYPNSPTAFSTSSNISPDCTNFFIAL
jgi:hypothetical protein